MRIKTIKVLHKIVFCSIIAVPSSDGFDIRDKIFFVTNIEHTSSKVELVPLTNLARLWDSKISLIHLAKGKELTAHQIKEQLRSLWEKVT